MGYFAFMIFYKVEIKKLFFYDLLCVEDKFFFMYVQNDLSSYCELAMAKKEFTATVTGRLLLSVSGTQITSLPLIEVC